MHFLFPYEKGPWTCTGTINNLNAVPSYGLMSMFVHVPIQLHTIVGVFHNCAQNQVTFKPLTTVTSQKGCKTTWRHLSWDCDISSMDYDCIAQFKSLFLGAPAVSTIFASQGNQVCWNHHMPFGLQIEHEANKTTSTSQQLFLDHLPKIFSE